MFGHSGWEGGEVALGVLRKVGIREIRDGEVGIAMVWLGNGLVSGI